MHTILAIDDAKDTLMLLEYDLTAEGYHVVTANSGDDGLAIVAEQDINMILLDMYMPGLSGLATLERLKADSQTAKIPVIMLSASNDEDEIVAALELGADDYVTKPYIAKVLLARLRTSQRLMEKTLELERLAQIDFLTSINNRLNFESLASKAIEQCNRHQQSIVVGMFDIDFFKLVNDQHGHEAGDKVLIEFSKILSDCFRGYDVVGRIGGEEFAVCMPNVTLSESTSACERLRQHVERQAIFINDETSISITVSIGFSLSEKSDELLVDMLRKSDQALYHAKETGRNKVVCFDELNNETLPSTTVDEAEEGRLTMNDTPTVENDNTEGSPFPGIEYEVGVANVLGDDDLFKEIVQMFYEDHHHDGEKIQQAIDNSDQPTLKHVVHTLKGVSSSIGAMALYRCCKSLDEAVSLENTQEYMILSAPVILELDKVVRGVGRALEI